MTGQSGGAQELENYASVFTDPVDYFTGARPPGHARPAPLMASFGDGSGGARWHLRHPGQFQVAPRGRRDRAQAGCRAQEHGQALAATGSSQGARLVEAWPAANPSGHATCTRAQTNGRPASWQQSVASDGDGCRKLLDCRMSNHRALICLVSVNRKCHGFLAVEPLSFMIDVRSTTNHGHPMRSMYSVPCTILQCQNQGKGGIMLNYPKHLRCLRRREAGFATPWGPSIGPVVWRLRTHAGRIQTCGPHQ